MRRSIYFSLSLSVAANGASLMMVTTVIVVFGTKRQWVMAFPTDIEYACSVCRLSVFAASPAGWWLTLCTALPVSLVPRKMRSQILFVVALFMMQLLLSAARSTSFRCNATTLGMRMCVVRYEDQAKWMEITAGCKKTEEEAAYKRLANGAHYSSFIKCTGALEHTFDSDTHTHTCTRHTQARSPYIGKCAQIT